MCISEECSQTGNYHMQGSRKKNERDRVGVAAWHNFISETQGAFN